MARLAKSLETLRAQIDALAPDRDKSSDGWIGDASHAASKSDHNPDASGVVHALDITDDPSHGVDASDLAEQIRVSKDERVQYIISDGRICNPDIDDWAWRPYTGSNPHNLHFHTSCKYEPELADDTSPWAIRLARPTGEVSVKRPTIQYGDKGSAVKEAQMLLGGLDVDGNFGTATDTATRQFQTSVSLPADGVIGPYTWEALIKQPGILPIPPPSSGRQTKIIATVFSSQESGKKGAYGDWLEPDDLFIALPAAFPKPLPFVRIIGPKGQVIAQIKDKGPWYDGTPQRPADEYWLTGARPRAESDSNTNGAGIDISQAVADAVGVPGKGPVDWAFVSGVVPTEPPEPEPPPTSSPFPFPIPWPPTAPGGGFPWPFPMPGQPTPPPQGGQPSFNLPIGDLFSVIGRASRIMALFQAIPRTGMTVDRYLAGIEEGLSVIVHGSVTVINQKTAATAPPPPILVPSFPATKATGVGSMNSSQILSIIRNVLLAPGGFVAAWLLSKGIEPSTALTVIEWLLSIGAPILAGIWGGFTHSNTNKVKAAAEVPGVTVGVNPSQASQAVVDVAHDSAHPKVLVTTPR